MHAYTKCCETRGMKIAYLFFVSKRFDNIVDQAGFTYGLCMLKPGDRRNIKGFDVTSGVRRIFQWGVLVTSHRDDVKVLHYSYSSLEVLKCIVL